MAWLILPGVGSQPLSGYRPGAVIMRIKKIGALRTRHYIATIIRKLALKTSGVQAYHR